MEAEVYPHTTKCKKCEVPLGCQNPGTLCDTCRWFRDSDITNKEITYQIISANLRLV